MSYDRAIEAIQRVHGDTSVPLEKTLEDLQGLRSEVDLLIDAIESDIDMKEDAE